MFFWCSTFTCSFSDFQLAGDLFKLVLCVKIDVPIKINCIDTFGIGKGGNPKNKVAPKRST